MIRSHRTDLLGALRAELIDIAVDQSFVVAVQRATATSYGRHLDVNGCQLMRLAQGRIAEVRVRYSGQDALDACGEPSNVLRPMIRPPGQ